MMTKVFVINNQDIPSVESVNHSGATKLHQDVYAKNTAQDLNEINEEKSLETERKHHYGTACKRQDNFKLIIEHGQFEFSWKKCIAYPVAIPIIGVLPTILMTLIPAHDLIQNPEYWYEILFHGLLQNTCLYSYMSLLAASLFNLKYIIQKKNVAFILFVGNLICLCLLWTLGHYVTPIAPFYLIIFQVLLMFFGKFSSIITPSRKHLHINNLSGKNFLQNFEKHSKTRQTKYIMQDLKDKNPLMDLRLSKKITVTF